MSELPQRRGLIAVLAVFMIAFAFWTLAGTGVPAGTVYAAYIPPNPSADIAWSSGYGGVADVQAAFSNARTVEGQQLGISLPAMALPTQAEWDGMGAGERALWLINQERTARGLLPMAGLDPNVTGVAQAYAQFIIDNNLPLGHYQDGSPKDRLKKSPTIAACIEGLAENLAAFWTSGNGYPLTVEQAVYLWMYEDGNCCDWGHRRIILTDMYTNIAPNGGAGLLGIGRAAGPHQGWNYGEIIVMDAINPCSNWDYGVVPPDLPPRVWLPSTIKH